MPPRQLRLSALWPWRGRPRDRPAKLREVAGAGEGPPAARAFVAPASPRPRCSGRSSALRAEPGWPVFGPQPGQARVPGSAAPASPHGRAPAPTSGLNGGSWRRRHSPLRTCRRAGRAPRSTLTRHSTRRLARRAQQLLPPRLLVTRSGRQQLRRRTPSGPAAASPRACAQRPLPTNGRKNHRGSPGAGEEGPGE